MVRADAPQSAVHTQYSGAPTAWSPLAVGQAATGSAAFDLSSGIAASASASDASKGAPLMTAARAAPVQPTPPPSKPRPPRATTSSPPRRTGDRSTPPTDSSPLKPSHRDAHTL